MLEIMELKGPEQTGREMYRLSALYASDIDMFDYNGMPLSKIPFSDYYDLVRAMPFEQDTESAEIVTRPFLLWASPWAGWDCKKKAIAIAAWLKLNNIPYRFTAVSRRLDGEVHHVIVEAYYNDKWIPIDATYSYNDMGLVEQWTAKKPLPLSGAVSHRRPLLLSISGPPNRNMIMPFVHLVNNHVPGTMGVEPITIAAIITAIASVITSVIGAASSKKSQERTLKQIEKEQARIAELEEKREEQAQETADFLKDWGVPALLSAAAAAITITNW